ncbi:MAG: DsbA family oxidoreductase [Burkholderiales bacterium]|nr:DsbA family oxidoreductase [Burkholderiales bacterium]
MTQPAIRIDVVSDVVCPWCYIGKRHLEQALATWRANHADAPVEVRWHPFQLNPDLPPEGKDRRAYLEAKFGGPERAAAIYARVKAAGANAGLAMNFDAIKQQPNTLLAHALIAYAQSVEGGGGGRGDAVVERLFCAYFVAGEFVGDLNVLLRIAAGCGLDVDATRDVLQDDATLQQIAAQDAAVRQQGVSGVPFFVFNQRLALSGAQPPDVLLQTMREAASAA